MPSGATTGWGPAEPDVWGGGGCRVPGVAVVRPSAPGHASAASDWRDRWMGDPRWSAPGIRSPGPGGLVLFFPDPDLPVPRLAGPGPYARIRGRSAPGRPPRPPDGRSDSRVRWDRGERRGLCLRPWAGRPPAFSSGVGLRRLRGRDLLPLSPPGNRTGWAAAPALPASAKAMTLR